MPSARLFHPLPVRLVESLKNGQLAVRRVSIPPRHGDVYIGESQMGVESAPVVARPVVAGAGRSCHRPGSLTDRGRTGPRAGRTPGAPATASRAGLYPGQPRRVTNRPTTERLLKALERVILTVIVLGRETRVHLTPLSKLPSTRLKAMGCPSDLYARLVMQSQAPPGI